MPGERLPKCCLLPLTDGKAVQAPGRTKNTQSEGQEMNRAQRRLRAELAGWRNHVIWFGLTWSLELYQQANGRLYRQGQKQKVIIHHLVVQGGMDEEVMVALEQKGDNQDRLPDVLKARIEKNQGGR